MLAFLDANTESNDGWLEPLLSRIASDRSVVAVPRVDMINITTLEYTTYDEGLVYYVGFNMYYEVWPIPRREIDRVGDVTTKPFRTPTLIGCAFAMDREFFFEVGSFDLGMDIWGKKFTQSRRDCPRRGFK